VKKKKLGRLKMILPFLLKMLPWAFCFLCHILALYPGYYLWCDFSKTWTIVNEGYCNRISVREVMFCHSATNSTGDHTQVIWHSSLHLWQDTSGDSSSFVPFLPLSSFCLFLVVSFILLVFSTYFLCFVIVLFVYLNIFVYYWIDMSLHVRRMFFWLWF
jgi:Flp pilus assembly protein TadB